MADAKSTGTARPASKTPEPAPEPEPRPFISEGVRADIEMHGQALDPATGRILTRKDLP